MLPQRRSIRLRGFDYTEPGAYFVTIVCAGRQNLLGDVVSAAVKLTPLGEIAARTWNAIPDHFPSAELDEFAVMPNHFHAIVLLNEDVGAKHASPLLISARGTEPSSVSAIVQAFKSTVTRTAHRQGLLRKRSPWQRGFFERVVRTEREMQRFRRYIAENPLRWEIDEENPSRPP